MDEKKCNNCVWFDQCGCDETCKHYTPAASEECEAVDESEYEMDLRNRYGFYVRQIEEQDF